MDAEQKKLAEEMLFSETKPLSFAQKLFFGMFDAKLVFPYPRLSPEQQRNLDKLLAKVTAFSDEYLDAAWIDKHADIPPHVISGLARLGVLGMTVPKNYGGLGMSQQAYCKVTEFIAGRCGSTALIINAHQSIGLKSLLLFGTRPSATRGLNPWREENRSPPFP